MRAGQTMATCKRGHLLVDENVYTRPGKPTHRECRTCRDDHARRRVKGPVPRLDEWRFFSRVRLASECWEFTALAPDGYGRFWFEGRNVRAHRWLYERMVAELPQGLQLDHLCRNRACVNPYHLEPVTPRVNTIRGDTAPARNVLKASCPAGHPYEGANLRITPTGHRVCRACHRRNAAESRRKRAA